jgi:hypothetical protein
MRTRYSFAAALLLGAATLQAQLTILSQFDPSNTAGTCGIAYNSTAGEVLVIECFGTDIDRYTEAGEYLSSAPIAGESANDVDIDMSPASFMMSGTTVEQGQLLLLNGETEELEIYAIDEVTMAVIDTLQTAYGAGHVVGGSYHPMRNTFFVIQDNVPGIAWGNRIAEIDPSTGDTVQTISIAGIFNVSYGDLDISPVSGHLFVVSSEETGIAEFTPEGALVQEHPLPVGVTSLSGIALDNDLEGAWVCNTGGTAFKLGNFPVGLEEEAGPAPVLLRENPAIDQLDLTLNLTVRGQHRIVLRDATGRNVRELYRGMIGADQRSLVFSLEGVPMGAYVLCVEGPDLNIAQKLTVARR